MVSANGEQSAAVIALRAWLASTGTTQAALRDILGASRSSVRRWAGGLAVPIHRMRGLIEEATGIAADAWGPPPKPVYVKRVMPTATADELSTRFGERVRAVPFAPGYFISETGMVIRATRRRGVRQIRPWLQRNGRRMVVMYIDGEQKCVAGARLVALVFIGSPPDDEHLWVCHRNDIPADNHVKNLYWGNAADNARDCCLNDHRTRPVLSRVDAVQARQDAAAGVRLHDIAHAYNVSRASIARIVYGRSHKHAGGPIIQLEISRQSRLVGMVRDGQTTRAAATALGMPIQTAHETISRARRLGQLPRLPRPTTYFKPSRHTAVAS